MYEWSVLKDSIPVHLEAANKSDAHWTFLHDAIENMLFQLRNVGSQEALYQLAIVHRNWDSPLINRIFFSGLNLLRGRFGNFFIDMLITEFAFAAYIPLDDRQRKETDFAKLVADGLADIFPEFTFIKREAAFDNFRVDLLAKMPASNRDVLFELKLGAEDPTPQLLKYASHFRNPILIGITEKRLPPQQKCENVHYITYTILNRRAAANICKQFGT